MHYDIRLRLEYDYDTPVAGARHLVRMVPPTIAGIQRVVATSLHFRPSPAGRNDHADFFGNNVTSVSYRDPQEKLRVTMSARVQVERDTAMLDVSPDLTVLRRELDSVRSIAPNAPHHFAEASPRVGENAEIGAYAREACNNTGSVREVVRQVGSRIHDEFEFDPESTDVETSPSEAFAQRRGVCQDFTHIMISGLRELGIPAGYVSGFLRTIPPEGQERLEGADAMHAWVRAWCGIETGWVEYDPTNDMVVSNDHITVAIGRDYLDAAPIVGVLRTVGSHRTGQFVDVIPVQRDPMAATHQSEREPG